jgi:hypothetical protein
MRKLLILTIGSFLLLNTAIAQKEHCDPAKESKFKSLSKPNKEGGYGKIIKKTGAITVAALDKKMAIKKEAMKVTITGTVLSVCKAKGCWMGVDKGNGESMRIRFKDYAFFVPRDIEGQTFTAQGTAYYDTTSVEMLKHYASDAKKPQSEIDAITKPEIELCFTAEGVLFEKK